MKQRILNTLEQSIQIKKKFISAHADLIQTGARTLARALRDGNKILILGNGGSAADAQHMAAEFVNRFQMERPPLAALALTTDSSVLTSIANDYAYDEIFSKQIRAIGQKGDIAVCISTSGTSPNVIQAARAAREKGIKVMGLSGPAGELGALSHLSFAVGEAPTARIQETHITLIHILCDLTERILFHD